MKFLSKKIRKILKERNGFTLTEMIVTVAIISILTGIVSVGIYGYLSTAYTTKVSETAKTIFYASQSYILEQKQMGKLESFNQSAEAYGEKIPWDDLKEILKINRGASFDEEDYKDNYSTESTRYILMEKGSSSSNPLYQIVKEATNDNSLLSHTFLLEYDEVTGVVRSVFYSEKTDRFGYDRGSDALAAKNNVILRSPESIHEKKQGYYGVDITGKKPASEVYLVEPANVTLFNGERLYLQWTDTNESNPEFDIRPELLEDLQYDITVYRQTADLPEVLMQFRDIGATDRNAVVTLDQADDKVLTGEGYRLAQSRDMARKSSTYQLILDDLHHSIFQEYTSKNLALPTNITVEKDVKAEDILFCEVTIKLNKVTSGLDATSLPASSNVQSSAFGGGEKEVEWITDGAPQKVNTNGTGVFEDGTNAKAFSVWNPRHLQNIRYGQNVAANAFFTQNATIDWKKPEGRNGKEIPYLSVVYTQPDRTEKPFVGNYTVLKGNGNKYFSLQNLSIQQKDVSKVGFVSQNMGTISGLSLENPKVAGSVLTGIVAGINGGTIENVTISKGEVTGSHLLGGITGYNTAAGTIKNVKSLAKIDGITALTNGVQISDIDSFSANTKGRYVGGLIGLNKGEASGLTTEKSSVTGTSYVGGVLGGNLASTGIEIDTLTNRNDIKLASNAATSEALEYFGGIVGYQGESTISKASNYGLLSLQKTSAITDGDKLKHIGGIAGYNDGLLNTCVNEAGSDQLTTIQNNCIAQIKKNTLPSYLGKFVGGIAGTNTENGMIKKCYNKNGVVLGNSVVGGFVGSNYGTDIEVRTDVGMSGLVIGSEYLVGGIFGYNAGESVENYVNQSNVFGKGMVGGITGFNGKTTGSNGEDRVLSYLNTLEKKTGNDYLSYLLEVEDKLKVNPSGKSNIDSCENKGFVFAQNYFGGGLAGVNFGKITRSNVDSNVLFPEIKELGKADCVGGIVGFNGTTGEIDGRKVANQTAQVHIVANNFVGGIVGLNHGTLSGYLQVNGTVYGKGDCVGGMIGLNTNASAISSLTQNATSTIVGGYFVGGIMGCNVALSSGANTHIKSAKSAGGSINALAYAGGILGYNAYVDEGTTIGSLFSDGGELTLLKQHAYTNDLPSAGELGDKTTIFENCDSAANVQANRYVGGIIGYNSSRANLWVVSSNNGGTIQIKKGSPVQKSADGATYYYIGGITGRNTKGGILHKCSNNGSVQSPSTYLGGICEVNEGYVQFCGSGKNANTGGEFGTQGDNSVGGITGLNRTGAYVVSCYADSYATIKGGNNTGGLVGTNELEGVITSNYKGTEAKTIAGVDGGTVPTGEASLSYCSAAIIGLQNTGGIVGNNQGSIAHIIVKSQANITGTVNVGGFVGYNAKEASISGKSGTIENLINEAKVYGTHEVGGIVGKHNATKIVNCENRGEVKAIGEKLGYAGGITGSNDASVTIDGCKNYGLVRSEHSFAGGITGINDGKLMNSDNYGSVQGSFDGTAVATQGDGVVGAAIGGVAGCNYRNGQIYDCASRDNGKSGNDKNKIQGNYIVGGIIGYYDQDKRYPAGEFLNKTSHSLEVDITIEPRDKKVDVQGRCKIGGVIGTTDPDPKPTVLKDYVFTGTINILKEAGTNEQEIGGIMGWQAKSFVLENCIFDGRITGYGNNPNQDSNAGIGGLAGTSQGTILVYPDEQDGKTIYTSNTKDAFVEGAKRAGGVVGETGTGYNVKLKIGDNEVALDNVNDGKGKEDYLYYENYATIKAGKWVGGFYGSVEHSSARLKNLKNNGPILTHNINGLSSMGGISGAAKMESIENCINTAKIGDEDDPNVMENVGGLVGYSEGGSTTIQVNDCHNTGDIYAGKRNIGGLFGTLKSADISYTCTSSGQIIVNQSNASSVVGVGGIIGRAAKVSIINDTTNLQIMVKDSKDPGILILGRAYEIGGLIGSAVDGNLISIPQIKNVIRIKDTSSKNTNQSVQTGGLIGASYGGGTLNLNGCINGADLEMQAGKEIGGLVGKLENRNITIKNCKNIGAIWGSESVAGMVGYINGGTSNFSHSQNEGTVTARIAVGGIVGYLRSTKGTMENCDNLAPISVSVANGGTVARYIGGCFGRIEKAGTDGSLQVMTCKNAGNLVVNENQVFTEMSNIGGVVGYLFGNAAFVDGSTNEGDITLKASKSGGQNAVAIGGIVGRIGDKAIIGQKDSINGRTTNTGKIEILEGLNNNVSQIGGIAGIVESESRLLYCSNQGDVIASMDSSMDIGGIAGKSSAAVYSCRTKGKVEGKTNVGGLIGTATTYASKVSSVGTNDTTVKGYDLSEVNSIIQGRERVGGVVGNLQEGTVYNIYVNPGTEVILHRDGTPAKEKSAGGIVGYAGSLGGASQTKGIISSCYNFGTVTDGLPSSEHYIGGIVGFREHLTGKAAANIVDCFNVDPSKIGETMPPTSDGVSGNVALKAWAVGNEPYGDGNGGSIYQDSADEQTYPPGGNNPLQTADKFCWSQAACDALRVSLGIASTLPYDSKEAILEIMQNYDGFKLPPPELISIVPVKGFQYTYSLKALPGFYTEYGFRVYEGEHEIGKIIPGDAVKTGIQSGKGDGKSIIYDFQKEFTLDLEKLVSEQKLEELVGKTLSVTTYAKGYSLDDLNYSKESDEIVFLQMVIMPPLPEPELVSIEPTTGDDFWFDSEGKQVITKLEITNWAKYQEAADTIYTYLAAVKDDDSKLFEPDLYDTFVNGLFAFQMTDTFVESDKDDLSGIKITHNIKPKDNSGTQKVYYEVIGDKAFITIDYTGNKVFNDNSGNKPWHAYEISARIKDAARGITINPLVPEFKYRYTDSLEKRGTNFRLKTKLKPPKNITTQYLGKRDPNDATSPLSYGINWVKDGGLDSTILGYKVELVGLMGNDALGNVTDYPLTDRAIYTGPPYVTTVNGVGTTKLILTKEQILQIFNDLSIAPPEWWGEESSYSLDYQITTLSKDENISITSEVSQPVKFPLIKQQPEIKVDTIMAAKDISGTNMKISWTDASFDPTQPGITEEEKKRHKYDVNYAITLNNQPIQSGTTTITGAVEWDGIILDPRLPSSAFQVTIEVVKQGEEGTDPAKVSLNSNKVKTEIVIGDRLELPINMKVVAEKQEADELYLHFTWGNTGNTATSGILPITEANCSGYQIDIVIDGKEEDPITTIVDGYDVLEANVVIPMQTGTTPVKFSIRALGKGSTEKSEWVSQSSEFTAKTMVEPQIVKINPDGVSPYKRGDYPTGEQYKLTVKVNEDTAPVEGQKIEILYKGELLREYRTSISSGSADVSVSLDPKDPADGTAIELAGEDVVIRISNMSSDIKTALPSQVTEFTYTMPRIKLDTPDPVLAKKEIKPLLPTDTSEIYNLYHARINVYDGLSDTEIQEEKDARTGQKIRMLYKDGSDWKEGTFILMKEKADRTGYEPVDGNTISSYEVTEDERIDFYFRLPSGFTGTEDDYKLVVQNLAKPDSNQKKYSDSEEAEVLFSSAGALTIVTLDILEMLPIELLPLPEEETTEESTTTETTEESTASGTTEESTTTETTEESTTTGTTEESTTTGTTEEHSSEKESTSAELSTVEKSTETHETSTTY